MGMKGCRKLFAIFTVLLILCSDLHLSAGYGVNEQLWLNVIHPNEVAYHYKILPAKDFGGVMTREVRGVPLVVSEPWHACSKHFTNGRTFRGRVVLVVRGECSFVTKAYNVQLQDALAVIVTNNDSEDIDAWIDMADDETGRKGSITIPAFYLLGKDGHKIKEALGSSGQYVALINIPVNITDTSSISQPNWDLW